MIIPGYQFRPGEEITIEKLNLLAKPIVSDSGGGGGGGSLQFASVQNLIVSVPTTTTISLSADAVILASSTTNLLVNLTGSSAGVQAGINISGFGAGGVETGTSLAANTWYYLYLISNGTNTAGLLSASATDPTLPSGYGYTMRVGAVHLNNGLTLDAFYQRGNIVRVDAALYFNNTYGTTWADGDTRATTPLASIVPPPAVALFGIISKTPNPPVMSVSLSPRTDGTFSEYYLTTQNGSDFRMIFQTPQKMYIQASYANYGTQCIINGYTLPINAF